MNQYLQGVFLPDRLLRQLKFKKLMIKELNMAV